MDKDNSIDEQNPLNNLSIDDIEVIKNKLLTLPWEELSKNNHVLISAVDNSSIINAADLVLTERAFLLGQVFQNSEIIPVHMKDQIVELIANVDPAQGPKNLLSKSNPLIPGLVINNNINLTSLNSDAKFLVNGLHNIHNIALLKIAEALFLEINNFKKYSEPKISEISQELDLLTSEVKSKIDRYDSVTGDQLIKLTNFLKYANRSGYEIVELKNRRNLPILINIISNIQDALRVVKYAYQNNYINQLDDLNMIVFILDKLKK